MRAARGFIPGDVRGALALLRQVDGSRVPNPVWRMAMAAGVALASAGESARRIRSAA